MRKRHSKDNSPKCQVYLLRLLCIIIIGGIIVPLMINLAYKIKAPITILEAEWDAGSALTFYGALLSGVLTVGGVAVTIFYEHNRRRIDEAILYKPILDLVGVNHWRECKKREAIFGYSFGFYNATEEDEKYVQTNGAGGLLFRNVGRGETSSTYLQECTVYETNWKLGKEIYSGICGEVRIGEIVKDEYFEIEILMPQYLCVPDSLPEELRITLRFNIVYKDMFDYAQYCCTVYVPYVVKIEERIQIEQGKLEQGESLVRVSYLIQEPLVDRKLC